MCQCYCYYSASHYSIIAIKLIGSFKCWFLCFLFHFFRVMVALMPSVHTFPCDSQMKGKPYAHNSIHLNGPGFVKGSQYARIRLVQTHTR